MFIFRLYKQVFSFDIWPDIIAQQCQLIQIDFHLYFFKKVIQVILDHLNRPVPFIGS